MCEGPTRSDLHCLHIINVGLEYFLFFGFDGDSSEKGTHVVGLGNNFTGFLSFNWNMPAVSFGRANWKGSTDPHCRVDGLINGAGAPFPAIGGVGKWTP